MQKDYMDKKIGAINGLRGFAILAVIYQHVFSRYTPSGMVVNSLPGALKFYPLALLSNGWFGVQLFFILSGFVLYLPYAEERRQMKTLGDAGFYYKRRASRLLPLYYFGYAVVVLWWNINLDKDFLLHFFLMMTATFNFTKEFYTPWYNSDLWSIGLEIWFSILFPLFVILARRMKMRNLFFITALISLGVRFAGAFMPEFEIEGSPYNVIRDSILGRMDDFVLGMFICDIYVNGSWLKKTAKPWVFIVAGFCLLLIGANIWDAIMLGEVGVKSAPLANTVNQAGFFLIICASLSVEAGVLKTVTANRVMQVLGMMSYSLYMWHHLILRLVMRIEYKFAPSEAQPFTVFTLSFYFFFFIFLSLLTYRYIEFGKKDWRELFLLKRRA